MRPRKRWIRGREARGRLGGKKDEVKYVQDQICSRSPVEDGPGADGEDEKFEREGDEKTIALNLGFVLLDKSYIPRTNKFLKLCEISFKDYFDKIFFSPHT